MVIIITISSEQLSDKAWAQILNKIIFLYSDNIFFLYSTFPFHKSSTSHTFNPPVSGLCQITHFFLISALFPLLLRVLASPLTTAILWYSDSRKGNEKLHFQTLKKSLLLAMTMAKLTTPFSISLIIDTLVGQI